MENKIKNNDGSSFSVSACIGSHILAASADGIGKVHFDELYTRNIVNTPDMAQLVHNIKYSINYSSGMESLGTRRFIRQGEKF